MSNEFDDKELELDLHLVGYEVGEDDYDENNEYINNQRNKKSSDYNVSQKSVKSFYDLQEEMAPIIEMNDELRKIPKNNYAKSTGRIFVFFDNGKYMVEMYQRKAIPISRKKQEKLIAAEKEIIEDMIQKDYELIDRLKEISFDETSSVYLVYETGRISHFKIRKDRTRTKTIRFIKQILVEHSTQGEEKCFKYKVIINGIRRMFVMECPSYKEVIKTICIIRSCEPIARTVCRNKRVLTVKACSKEQRIVYMTHFAYDTMEIIKNLKPEYLSEF